MTVAAKIGGIAGLPVAEQLLPTQHIEDLKLDLELIAGRLHHPTDHQSLAALDLPVAEVDLRARRGPLQHVLAIHGRKPAGAGKISGHDGRSILRRRTRISPAKGHHGNRHRLVHAGGDLDLQLGTRVQPRSSARQNSDSTLPVESAHEVLNPEFQTAILAV